MAMEDLLKKVLCVINIIYAVFGLAISATGLWFLAQIIKLVQLRHTNYYLQDSVVHWPQVASCIIIIVGILIILVACIGWSGTSKESSKILRVYGGVMTFLLVLKIVSPLLAFMYFNSNEMEHFVIDTIYDGFTNIRDNRDTATIYEFIERNLKCCGVRSPLDYESYRNGWPPSCCADYPRRTTCYAEAIRRSGCANAVAVYIKTISFSMAAALLLPTVLEISGIIVARRLSHLFKEVEHYSKPMY